jgi:hypothetical protein
MQSQLILLFQEKEQASDITTKMDTAAICNQYKYADMENVDEIFKVNECDSRY